MKHIVILGSTGSIGTQTLDVLGAFPDAFNVVGLSAGSNMALLAQQVVTTQPSVVCVGTSDHAATLAALLAQHEYRQPPEILVGEEGLCTLAACPEAETVVVGLVGFTGLPPTLAALQAGKQVLTANKETFVVAGPLVKPYLSQIIPLDSEHNAIFQCLQGAQRSEVRKIFLTASGGPFREMPLDQLADVTPEQALRHPTWTMGDKVTIDCATMMNKGLEVIEAHYLFAQPLDNIAVVIHPQSMIHSAVAFVDGSILAQMGCPDMRIPLQYGLTYPKRWPTPFAQLHLDLTQLGSLEFLPVDAVRYPCMRLARWAAEIGGTLPVVLNAADEMAVQAFIRGAIRFTDIPRLIEQIMQTHLPEVMSSPTLAEITQVNCWTRQRMESLFLAKSR